MFSEMLQNWAKSTSCVCSACPASLKAERTGVSLKGDGADHHAAQTKEPRLPHGLNDGAGEMVRCRQPGGYKGADDFAAFLEVGLDLREPVHTIGDALVGDRTDIELLSLAFGVDAVVPIHAPAGAHAHEAAALAVH